MDKNKIMRQKQPKSDVKKEMSVNIRISKDISDWLNEKDYSPTGIFYEALRDLKCPHVDEKKE